MTYTYTSDASILSVLSNIYKSVRTVTKIMDTIPSNLLELM